MATPRKQKRRPQSHQTHNHSNSLSISQPPQAITDYETDFPDIQPPPMTRTNEELNLNVLRRYYPDISLIISIAPYAVLYTFSPETSTWNKSDIEGSLFISALEPSDIGAERFNVVILNRRGFDNFEQELKSSEDVELTTEYVILKGEGENGVEVIYGIWIFAEPEPSSTALAREVNAGVIENCAKRAETSQRAALERVAAQQKALEEEREYDNGDGYLAEESELEETGVPMGRQVSLRELFGRQREQDSGFSATSHESPQFQAAQLDVKPVEQQVEPLPPSQTREQVPVPQFITHPDTDFFRSGPRFTPKQDQPPTDAPAETAANGGGVNILDGLFRNARQATA